MLLEMSNLEKDGRKEDWILAVNLQLGMFYKLKDTRLECERYPIRAQEVPFENA